MTLVLNIRILGKYDKSSYKLKYAAILSPEDRIRMSQDSQENIADKTVLMVSYYYPPLAGIGALRTLKFARYLPEHGWRPLILTPAKGTHTFMCSASEGDLEGVDVVRTGYFDVPTRLKRYIGLKTELPISEQTAVFGGKPRTTNLASRCLGLAKSVLLFPDPKIGWYHAAVSEGLATIKRDRPDVIYSTSPPVTAHLVAKRLHQQTGIPWVADLRDLWSENHQTGDWPRWRQMLDARLEKKTLSRTDGVVTVSDKFARQLSCKLGRMNGRLQVIANGYDPEDYLANPPEIQEKFTISHMGDLYGMSRDPGPLFRALASLVAKGIINPDNLLLNFIGNPPQTSTGSQLDRLAREAGVAKSLRIRESVSYQQSLQLQQSSTVLLLVEILNERSRGVIPGKLFEYLGAHRPTLALVPRGGEAEKLIEATRGGRAFDPRLGEAAIEETIGDWYRQWLETGTVLFEGSAEAMVQLTRQHGASRLAHLLDRVASASESSQ